MWSVCSWNILLGHLFCVLDKLSLAAILQVVALYSRLVILICTFYVLVYILHTSLVLQVYCLYLRALFSLILLLYHLLLHNSAILFLFNFLWSFLLEFDQRFSYPFSWDLQNVEQIFMMLGKFNWVFVPLLHECFCIIWCSYTY